MNRLKVTDFGSDVQGVTLRGDRSNPEPMHFRVVFPGGDVDIVRTTVGDYWVHVRANNPPDELPPHDVAGKIVDARLDIRGRHTHGADLGDFADPGLFHLAVRVAVNPAPDQRQLTRPEYLAAGAQGSLLELVEVRA